MSQINGRISQIIGPVIDVYFDTTGQDAEKVLPKIHDALKIDRGDGRMLVVEVQQHIGEDTVRCPQLPEAKHSAHQTFADR